MTFLCCNTIKPTVAMDNHRMVLSLPDAMTPVAWVIDLKDIGTFVMRVERNDSGLYILQKIEGAGQTLKIEDIAYYTDQEKAVRAMSMVSTAVVAGENPSSCHRGKGWERWVWRLVKLAIFVAAGLFLTLFALAMILTPPATVSPEQIQQMGGVQGQNPDVSQTNPQPDISTDPTATGVPLSADDYLQKKNTGLFPF